MQPMLLPGAPLFPGLVWKMTLTRRNDVPFVESKWIGDYVQDEA